MKNWERNFMQYGNKLRDIFFFIGTEAELIKVFPVINACQDKGGTCHIIASGQNNLLKSRILSNIRLNGKIIELSKEENIKKNAIGLLRWFVNTSRKVVKQILNTYKKEDLENACLIVHGDTVSTVLGAWVGRKLGMKVCHIEAGLRSNNLLNPFPEEIDRILTSRFAKVHFAPGDIPASNLQHIKGEVINTKYNTILDSLAYSRKMPILTEKIKEIGEKDYFVFVMHRQENLANAKFVKQVIKRIETFAQKRICVIILHKITENTFDELGILAQLKGNDNFILLPRVDYFDFMKLLDAAQFVITDGGSNQEELSYMGKPCLIMRRNTERSEGIGKNAVMYDGNLNIMDEFEATYKKYMSQCLLETMHPSEIIAEKIICMSRYT